ncbi:nucleotidyltransferase family protein [Aquirufa antheringensis]|uniref:nucleotidyltransferase family protein n=1 Tax=Aquirufa antheringensis TaxID=2516559 RepID=UPI0022A9C3A1|nr:nucleotidyltransferase family protein [Aquirufa antheringensis]MCZ2484752.1 NTP transferase domain-containing protein [Aquirufa antheringensis]
MKQIFDEHLVDLNIPIKICLQKLNQLSADAILFVIDQNKRLVGSLTDGDVRRGIINGLSLEDEVRMFIQPNPKFIQRGNYNIHEIIEFRNEGYKIIPVIDQDGKIVKTVNFRFLKSYLPLDVVIMAGGKGERLKPLTDLIPKPLLKVGDKSIIRHNLDRLLSFGIDDFWISIRYLGDQIKEKIGDGQSENVKINYVSEDTPLGTIGAVSKILNFEHEYVLITNSDILTNLDYEQFFLDFIDSNADFSVATIPYNVNVPYAILETADKTIKSFKEKPTYTYFANAGIYLMKREVIRQIPQNQIYNATDLLDKLIKNNFIVRSFPLRGYWLDIGKHDDYTKAQEDINYIKF